jgi:hypothetical protein
MSVSPPPLSAPPGFHPEPLQAVACPVCFGAVAVSQDLLGQAAECPLCRSGFRVPLPGLSVSPPQASAASAAGSSPHKPRLLPRTRSMTPAGATDLKPPQERIPTASSEPVRLTQPEDATDEPQAAAAEMHFHEPVRTVGSGDHVVTLHRLTAEEKAVRRSRRNLVMLLGGVSILMTIVLLLGTKPTKRRGR